MSHIGLDFETYGSVDLNEHGLDRYIADPHFTPLIARAFYVSHGQEVRESYDFVHDMEESKSRLELRLRGNTLVAQNAGFELAVLKWLGIEHPLETVVDSAVVARAAGAASSLASCAPQLLNTDKMDEGRSLIQLFSVPSKEQRATGRLAFDPQVIVDNPLKWTTFGEYCDIDAELSWRIVSWYLDTLTKRELNYQQATFEMNQVGWPVDVEMVKEMQRRYLENVELAKQDFRAKYDVTNEKFFNSMPQMKQWCADRGIKATSFDEKHVASLHKRITQKLDSNGVPTDKREQYQAVVDLLETKQVIGGSSLKKLAVILNTVGADGRLRDQYMHAGAGQTMRTTGRSVQMQNLKRFTGDPADMSALFDDEIDWDNETMAVNLRQVFTSSQPDGALIVGDFSSVESRGLAWMSDEEWKLKAYRHKRDVYKDLASKIYGSPYEDITKSERQTGKVGELSCGYGAGAGAVQSFASGMGVTMTEPEAVKLVSDWRAANPGVVSFWQTLDDMLHAVVETDAAERYYYLADGFKLILRKMATPTSLRNQHRGGRLQSIAIQVMDSRNELFLNRIFHGCHTRGRNIGYYKPTDRRSGDRWTNTFVSPKTKQREFHTIYGGKLAGILTQSFCRELFFLALWRVREWVALVPNLTLIGQFHDEIVLDWVPGGPGDISLGDAKVHLESIMSDAPGLSSFPMAAEIKHDYRYTK